MSETPPPSRYPTEVIRLDQLCTPERELWLKNDGATDIEYGGNKVRKLERILPIALSRDAKRLVTFGAVGSHHVLTTAIFARRAGLRSAAILIPQPRTAHAEQTLCASLGQGLEAHSAESPLLVPLRLARLQRRGDYVIPPGGSNLPGTLAYVDAVRELVQQIRAGALPSPDRIVVALGSGGTASGLLAGVIAYGLTARVVAVDVVGNRLARALVMAAAARALRNRRQRFSLRLLAQRLQIVSRQLGAGYGKATQASERALATGRALGWALDPTYTAKAFAELLEPRNALCETTLYWHTLSCVPLAALLERAPTLDQIPTGLSRLFDVHD